VDARFYTFYGNALGAPAAIGDAGAGRVHAVGTPASERFYASFRQRFPKPQDDSMHARMQVMIETPVAAMERARNTAVTAVVRALEGIVPEACTLGGFHRGWMRDQFIQPVYVSMMERAGTAGVAHDNEGSGYGFTTMRYFEPRQTEPPQRCKMQRHSKESM
jgi:branched-chain amino acid transport system substrate-binding protein